MLATCDLVATGTTGERLDGEAALDVERTLSGPHGGDLQIRRRSRRGRDCHGIVFFRDPLTAQTHGPDVTGLRRIRDVHDVPLATNRSSADALLETMPTG